MKPKVLVTATNFSQTCPDSKRLLAEAGFEVAENPHQRPMSEAELTEAVHDVSAVLAGVDAWDEKVFRLAPKLRIISRFGVGVDNVDIPAATRFGIVVANCPGANANAVADLALGLMLSLTRQIPRLDRSTRKGLWERAVGVELWGKTLGLVGLGHIGKLVALRAKGFAMTVLAYDVYRDEEFATAHGLEWVELPELLRRSDFVSLHAPVTPETRHLINREALALMQPHAYLINTARGALVDESALLEALETGRIAGAGLDVYEVEPAAQNQLFAVDNVVLTPHTGAETREAIQNISLAAADNVIRVFKGEKPRSLLNPEAWERMLSRFARREYDAGVLSLPVVRRA